MTKYVALVGFGPADKDQVRHFPYVCSSEVLRLAHQDAWAVLSHVPVDFRVTDQPVDDVLNLPGSP